MIKCGFYIENDGLKSVDCTDLRKGNPGIGGVEYATLLVAEWLSLTKDDISLTLYVRSSQNLPPSIHVNVCSDVMEALVKSVNNGDEIFVLRFEPLYLQRHLLDNSFLHKLKIVLWAHNFYSRRYLSYFDSLSFVKAIVNVGREQLDAYRDHHAFYKSTFIYNGLYVSDEPVREFGERADEVTYVGGLYPAKGVHYLTQAWPEVLSEFPDAKLNIIGSGKLYSRDFNLGTFGIADIKDLSSKIVFLLKHNGNDMSQVREYVKCNFSMAVVGEKWYELLQDVHTGKPMRHDPVLVNRNFQLKWLREINRKMKLLFPFLPTVAFYQYYCYRLREKLCFPFYKTRLPVDYDKY